MLLREDVIPGPNKNKTFVQRRPNVFDLGPALYQCYTNVLCLMGWLNHVRRRVFSQTATIILTFASFTLFFQASANTPYYFSTSLVVITPTNTIRWLNVVLIVGHRLRYWPNIKTTLDQRRVVAETSQKTDQRGASIEQTTDCAFKIKPRVGRYQDVRLRRQVKKYEVQSN